MITILVTLLIFGLLVTVHELGHYLVARASGVAIIEFSIGMGPKIKSWQGKINTFSIRALPIGGYVRMAGEPGEDDDVESMVACIGRKPINEVNIFKRMLIVLAGPFMNILLAFLVMLLLVSTSYAIGSTQVAELMEHNESGKYGLQPGDIILEVDGKTIHCFPDLSYKIMADGAFGVDILVERDGEEKLLENVVFAYTEEEGIVYGALDFKVYRKDKTPLTILYESFWQGYNSIYMTVDSLIDTFKGRYGLEAVGGPVAIGEQIGEAMDAADNFADTLRNLGSMTMMISVSLGIMNLLPIPALDGGRFLIYVIEAIRRKPLSKKVEERIVGGTMVALLVLMALVFFKDIVALF
ncbi:MAG: site-2 protease family protein [Clostridia bacterium]|nr:site-2 protease family protein [Clostridia bacterium]